MVNVGLFIRLEAMPGKEGDVDNFLREGLFLVEDEPNTTAWFAIRIGPSTFGIFDVFLNDAGRQEHLSGKLATALGEKTNELFTTMPTVEKVNILAAKLPQLKRSDYEE
jgi:hypothetical protein